MYIVSSIKTFQMIWNVLNTSESLPKFVIFTDILPFNSKQNLHCLIFPKLHQDYFCRIEFGANNDVQYVQLLTKM